MKERLVSIFVLVISVVLLGQTPGGKVHISSLSLLDADTRSVMTSGDAQWIAEAVEEGLDTLVKREPRYAANAPGHNVANNDANAQKLLAIYWDPGLSRSEKVDKIVNELMVPYSVDKLVSGQFQQKPDGSIGVRLFVIDRETKGLLTEAVTFAKNELDCRDGERNRRVCRQAFEDIRDLTISFIDPKHPQGRIATRLLKQLGGGVSDDPRTIGVLFATNRVVDHQAQGLQQQITFKRSSELTYGVAGVRVPEAHVIGTVERPLSLTIFGVVLLKSGEIEQQHFVMKDLKLIDKDKAAELLRSSKTPGVMIFVHGYNASFEDSVFRTAQVAYDTRFQGIPIAFIWPSKGGWADYDYDRESAQFSREAFVQLVRFVQDTGEASKIYIIAHSMGNQIVLDALAHAQHVGIKLMLSEIIMAAPDVDKDNFVQLVTRLKQIANGLTLYASAADKAMKASRLKASAMRAGDVPDDGPIVIPGILDTIDITALGDDPLALNHAIALSNRSLIDDIGRLLRTGTRPPGDRSPQLIAVPNDPPARYWRYPR